MNTEKKLYKWPNNKNFYDALVLFELTQLLFRRSAPCSFGLTFWCYVLAVKINLSVVFCYKEKMIGGMVNLHMGLSSFPSHF